MSLTPPPGGRGRSSAAMRRAHARRPDREDFLRRWSMLMIASFRTAEDCAEHFSVTLPCACNWREGMHRPSGDHVDFAQASLPEYERIMRGG
ncbi:hypothetical protein FIU66_07290 [Paracoccus sp. AK26]|nr:hypothetical protein FIU66_07290 [Paracoccus sp. AK26]